MTLTIKLSGHSGATHLGDWKRLGKHELEARGQPELQSETLAQTAKQKYKKTNRIGTELHKEINKFINYVNHA